MILVLGAFDGFHRGHQLLFEHARRMGGRTGSRWGVLTFSPHPQCVLSSESFTRLFSDAEREIAACIAGIPDLLVLPFTRSLADAPPEIFLDQIGERFAVRGIVVGADFRFGKARTGDVSLLARECAARNWDLDVVEPLRIDDATVSSSRIRRIVQGGNMEETEKLLGYPYFVMGHVICGDHRGRSLGFPTANLAVHAGKLLPPSGVYGGIVYALGKIWGGAVNLGFNPTFAGTRALRFEAHLLDFCGDLYGKNILVFLLQRLREERRFAGAFELVEQMERDKEHARFLCTAWRRDNAALAEAFIACSD